MARTTKTYRAILTFIAAVFCAHPASAEPYVWQLNKGELTYSVIGTIHFGDQPPQPLPTPLPQLLQQANGLIVEADIRHTSAPTDFPAGPIVADVLNSEQQTELKRRANELNLPWPGVLGLQPWLVAIHLQQLQAQQHGLRPQWGIDLAAMATAESFDVPIFELEDLDSQFTMLQSLPENGGELLLQTLDEWDHSESLLPCLLPAWREGDIAFFKEQFDLDTSMPDTEQALLTDRNQAWVNALMDNYSSGHYVVMVGMLHLIGPDSLPKLLQQQDFTLIAPQRKSASINYTEGNCTIK
uniref:TraB/GumN family protein n=1 Tax=Thaumasiovibrio occultus TaxID=1891184 RepID=UPI000B35D77D|nr:TraB/GumN family protein [Thaumasiovibrio occultus]